MLRSRSVVLAAVSASVLSMAGGVAAATAAVPAVQRATATTQSSSRVVLSWTNPSAPSFAATVVRMARGAEAPVGPTKGHRVATVRKSRHSLTVTNLAAGTRYTFALFATDGRQHFARPLVVGATTGPAPVTHLAAYTAARAISLQWTNPTTKSFAKIVVRYTKGNQGPARPNAGRPARLTTAKATTATLSHLRKDTTYTVSIWARDHQHRLSAARHLSFTTNASPTTNAVYAGRVTDTAGAPLAHAEVEANEFLGGNTYATTTGSTGRFVLALPADQPYFIEYGGTAATGGNSDVTGYQGFGESVSVKSGHTTHGRTVALPAGGAVTGRVTDATGHPLQGVAPFATPNLPYVNVINGGLTAIEFDLGPDALGRTAADGTYTLKGLSPQAVSICFNTAAQPISGGVSDAPGYAAKCDPATVAVRPRATAAHGDTALDATPTASISGRVTNAAGSGLANVSLIIDSTNVESSDEGFTTTDRDGRYQLSGLAPGGYQLCVFADSSLDPSPAGYQSGCRARPVTLTVGHPSVRNLVLRTAAAVTGKVVGPTGRPLAGVQVDVDHPAKHHSGPTGSAITDATGHYTVKGLPATTYRACFEASSATGTDDPTGTLRACPPRRFRVRVGSVRTGIDAQVKAAGAIAGTLTDSHGHPVADAEVDIESTKDPFDFGALGGFAQTDSHGRYRLGGLIAGTYRVCFSNVDITSAEIDKCVAGKITVRIGHTRRHADAVLPPAASLVVSVHDSAGHPISGVNAAVLAPCTGGDDSECTDEPVFSATKDVNVVASWITGQSGAVKFDDLRPGRYVVCLFAYYGATTVGDSPTGYADACSGTTFRLKVTENQTKTVTKMLTPAGVVTGRVTDSSGHPLAGVRVHVTHSAADNYYTDELEEDLASAAGITLPGPAVYSFTRLDGTYSIRSVTPGQQTVCLDARNASGGTSTGGYLDQCVGGQPGANHGTAVSVTGGATTDGVDLALTSGAAIAGTIRRPSGHPISEAEIEVFASNGKHEASASADEHGRYTVAVLSPGAKTVCFEAFRYASQCYDRVAWDGQSLPAQATKVTVTAGVTATGIDAELHRS